MANDWYVSSAAYATYTAFQGSHLYSIGNIIVPTSPAAKSRWVFRCTTGGTSTTEPTWSTAPNNNSTITSGTATFTNVSGQSTYFWTAAAGDLATLVASIARIASGDRCFISSDHSETVAGNVSYGGFQNTNLFSNIQYLCVNRAGSTPPVAADLTTGAVITINSGSLIIDCLCESYHYGITYANTAGNLLIGNSGFKSAYLNNCQLFLNNATSSSRIQNNNKPVTLIMDNSTVKFGHVGQCITGVNDTFQIDWQNTASAIAGATIPTVLFSMTNTAAGMWVTCRGVDFSAETGTLVNTSDNTGNPGSKYLFDSCKIASGVTRYSATNTVNTREIAEFVNCYDGTNILSESYQVNGTLTTETTITLTGGAADDVGAYSHKIVTNVNIDTFVNPFCSFWMDVENTTTGVSKTATVEIIGTSLLFNEDIALYLQYEGTAGSSVASFGNSFIATPLTAPAAVTTSTATWNASPSVTPITTGGFASSVSTAQSTGNAGANSIYLTKVTLVNNATVSAVWLNVSSGTSANFRVLIYDSSHNALVAEGSATSLASSGVVRFALTGNWSASAGTYYVGYVADTGFGVYIDGSQTSSSWFVSGGQSVASPANPLVGGSSQNNGLQIALEFAFAGQSYGWGTDYSANVALSVSNTVATFSGSALSGVRSVVTQTPSTGKYYCEVLVGGTVDSTCLIGVQAMSVPPNGATADFFMSTYTEAGAFGGTGVTNSGTPSSWTSGDIIGIAYDTATKTIWYNKNNGSWQGGSSPDPVNGTGGIPFTSNVSVWPVSVVAMRGASSTAAVYTLQDRSTSQNYSPPYGFQPWATIVQKQKCQVTFTPQHAGRLRGQIRIGKASATVYINPQITVS